ncbi:hypothetical protein [Burkholderia pseudomultivorans]|nr:hypothetical protein [Burkholderia pseudomultivorans]
MTDMVTIPRALLQDLIDDVSDYAASREFKPREKAWRDDVIERARALLAPTQQPSGEVTDEPTPDYMTCESRRPFAVNSIRARAEELRGAEKRCRNAFRKDFMGAPARFVADAYGEAAAALKARLAAIDAARAQGGES